MANGKITLQDSVSGFGATLQSDTLSGDVVHTLPKASGELVGGGNQTIAGVKTFSLSPIVPTPATGTQAVNKDYADLKVALTQFTGDNQSLSANGYQKLPGGLILQWGITNARPQGTSSIYITLPLSFPSAGLLGLADALDIGTIYDDFANAGAVSKTTIRIQASIGNIDGARVSWIAIGY